MNIFEKFRSYKNKSYDELISIQADSELTENLSYPFLGDL